MELESSSSSFSKPKSQWTYDVFINFRGEDTRRSFVCHLNCALSKAGVKTFLDEENLHKGMKLDELMTAIEGSQIAIVVFSKSYTESTWCLRELEKVIECNETYGQSVLPVFYNIDPSVVRHRDEKHDFGKVLKSTAEKNYSGEHLENAWSRALSEASKFSGWDASKFRNDAELVEKIVEDVLTKIEYDVLPITKFPVGLKSRVQKVIGFIENQSTRACIIVIWGMGGSGKTTAAKAIYNEINCRFGHKSFIEDIREVCSQTESKGLVSLQEKLLSEILKTNHQIQNVGMGTIMIEKRLSGKRVLIVLDDVNEIGQVEDLCENCEWFGPGTGTIAIEGLALQLHLSIRDCFKAEAFQEMKRLRLLRLDHVQLTGDYGYLSKQLRWIYWKGFPLNYIPNNFYLEGVIAIDLKHSNLKLLWKKTQHLLHNDLGDLPPMLSSISNLRSFLVQCDTEFQLHKQVKAMHIVYGVNYTELENSKNYLRSDFIGIDRYQVFNTLTDDSISEEMGTIEAWRDVLLPGDYHPYWLTHTGEGHSVCFTVPEDCPLKGMALCVGYSSTPKIMATKCLISVVMVNYTKCTIQIFKRDTVISFNYEDWQGIVSHLGPGDKVKIFVLFHQELVVKKTAVYLACDKSIGKEMEPPPSAEKFRNMLVAKKFRNMLVAKELVTGLVPFGTVIADKLKVLERLKILNLSHSKYLTKTPDFSGLPSLEKLILKDCPRLRKNNDLGDLAPMLSRISNLRSVWMQCDTEFQLRKQVNAIMNFGYGVNFTVLENSKNYRSYFIGIGRYQVFNTLTDDSISEEMGTIEAWRDVLLPGDNHPYWLTHTGEGHSVCFTVPEDCPLKGMALCVGYSSTPKIMATKFLISVVMVNYTKCTIQIFKRDTVISFNYEDWQGIVSHFGPGDKVKIFVLFDHGLVVKKTAVYLACDKSIGKEMKPSANKKFGYMWLIVAGAGILVGLIMIWLLVDPREMKPSAKKFGNIVVAVLVGLVVSWLHYIAY
ncbi:TMV resistance protein N [Glycine soja]